MTAAGSSRLLSGNFSLHQDLESDLSSFLGAESCLIFGAGYLANLGVLAALPSRHDVVFSDKLVHASAIDGISLSRASHRRFRHNDLGHLERLLSDERARVSDGTTFFIVVESLYSMDGDLAPLAEIVELARTFDAITIVDEAHALGVFGPNGRGCVAAMGLSDQVDVITGTLSKAFASYGGLVACSTVVKEYLINSARSFIYNTALPPVQAAVARESVRILNERPTLGSELLERAELMRCYLLERGVPTMKSESQIIPIPVAGAGKVTAIANALSERGVIAPGIRSPTVAIGSERLRLSITLAHSESLLEEVAQIIAEEISSAA
jgi:8-amino-7-oxononanoate synthase